MITISTASPAEAEQAARILAANLSRDVGFEIYLRGKLFSNRQALPPRPEVADWPSDAEYRG